MQRAFCRCPDAVCPVEAVATCGNDGSTYPSPCHLQAAACEQQRNISLRHAGPCDPCEGVQCPSSQVCQLDEHRSPMCRCSTACAPDLRPVCGSDGRTYPSECKLRAEACRARRPIRVIYTGECSAGANPCEALSCGPSQDCDIDRFGIASCVCPTACEPVMRPVCGTDGRTHHSPCHLRRTACLQGTEVTILHHGECGERGPCHSRVCEHGAVCAVRGGVHAVCECAGCGEELRPVCGSDGLSYASPCHLQREACQRQEDIGLAHLGFCEGCESKRCDFYAVCESSGDKEARCVCPRSCIKVEDSVCGTDGVTYLNECEMRVAACNKQQHVVVGSRGPCDLCQDVHCKYGARCEGGQCVCPDQCPGESEPVCGSDGRTHRNECEMRREACRGDPTLRPIFHGECGQVAAASPAGGCRESECRHGARCDASGRCACLFRCESGGEPVCGSDGRLHDGECALREEACRRQTRIVALPIEACTSETRELACDGEPPLVDPLTGMDYDCGHPDRPCPPSSYCQRTATFAKCCKQAEVAIEDCSESSFGCCPDGMTAALGLHNAGCPSECQCNRLGSVGLSCDPVSRQCACKPGVGGLRCDRCEPGFWGLHKAAHGCAPCDCNGFGAVRADCEQMSGRCVCQEGISGLKCDVCPPGTVLGPDGCMDVSISKAVSGSCADLRCVHGAECAERDGLAQCRCRADCAAAPQRTVCGTDGATYASECQMRLFGCRYQKAIAVAAPGPCKRGAQGGPLHPTSGPARRSTVQRLSETKSTREVARPDPDHLATSPTLATPAHTGSGPVSTPQFSGRSFLELPRLRAASRLLLELEFRSFARDGILLYNGQSQSGAGDFVSLALRDSFLEFRFNLGSGPVVLRSPQPLHLGRFHRLAAKRYLRDGVLTLEGQGDVAGHSRGHLKSLDLADNLFLGFVPAESEGIFANMAVSQGMVGCIRRLRIGEKEVDLRYPTSPDILRGSGIQECGSGACAAMPCLNGGACSPDGHHHFTCSCLPGFTGKTCEELEDACARGPCADGSTCEPHPGGFTCRCPPDWTGDLCDQQSWGGGWVPEFGGAAYLEFPTLSSVQRELRLELWFLSRRPAGLLLYNGGPRGDFVALALRDSFLEFRFDLGTTEPDKSGVVIIRSPRPVSLGEWHVVKATRLWRNGSLQVDQDPPVAQEAKASLSELNLEQSLYVGGVPERAQTNPAAAVGQGLDGAVQRIAVNGHVWERLLSRARWAHGVRRYRGPPCGPPNATLCFNGGVCVPRFDAPLCRCPPHFWGAHCEKRIGKEDLQRPIAFDGSLFLSFVSKFVDGEGQRENSAAVRFRTRHPSGLLLWTGGPGGDFLQLALDGGRAQLSFRLGRQAEPLLLTSPQRVDDALWHTALLERSMRAGSLTIDDHPPVGSTSAPGATELNTDGVYWIGGSPSLQSEGFRGCMQSVVVDGEPLPLVQASDLAFCDSR